MSASSSAATVSTAGPSGLRAGGTREVDSLLDLPVVNRKVSVQILERFENGKARSWLQSQIVGWRSNLAEQQAFEKLHGVAEPARAAMTPTTSSTPSTSKATATKATSKKRPLPAAAPNPPPTPSDLALASSTTPPVAPAPDAAPDAKRSRKGKGKKEPAKPSPANEEDAKRSTRWLRFFTKPGVADARLDELEICVDLAIEAGRKKEIEIKDLKQFVFDYFSSPGMGRLVLVTKDELKSLGCANAFVKKSVSGASHPSEKGSPGGAAVGMKSNSTYCDFDAELVLDDSHWYSSLLRDYSPAIQTARDNPSVSRSLGLLQIHQCVHLDGVQLSDRSSEKSSGWTGNGPTARQCHAEMETVQQFRLCGGEMINATDARRDCAGPAIRVAEREQSGEIPEGKTVFAGPAQQRLDQLELKLFFGFLDARYGLKVRAAVAKGAEAAVALDVAPYGHSLLIDPSRLRYTTTLFGYPLPVYTERHAKFTALTTKPFCRSILLLRTALHYTDIEAEYLHGTNDSLLLGAPHLVKQIYEALARNAKMPILSFDWLCDRLGFSTTSSITNIFALVTEAEKEIRDWSFPDWTKAPQPDPPVEEVAVRQYSAVRANSPLADIVTLAKAEKHGGGQIPWTDIPLRAQNFLLATFRLVDPARTPPSGLVSVRALLSEFGAVTHKNGVFGKTSSDLMDRLYGLPSKLRDHLHQRATTFESSLSSQNSSIRNWMDEAHQFLRYETVLHLASNKSEYRSTKLWLQAINEALPESQKIKFGARRMKGPKSDIETLGSYGPLNNLTSWDSVLTPVGNSFIRLIQSKGLEMKVVDTIFGSKARADHFKATVWAELNSKMDAGWDMGRLYSVMNMGGLCTFNCHAARKLDPTHPTVADTAYWFEREEGKDRNWSFIYVINGALLDKLIYFEQLPNMQIEIPPPNEMQ